MRTYCGTTGEGIINMGRREEYSINISKYNIVPNLSSKSMEYSYHSIMPLVPTTTSAGRNPTRNSNIDSRFLGTTVVAKY
jgi:hypothetical protein